MIDSAALTAAASLPAGLAAETEGGRQARIGVVGGGFGTQFYWHEHPNCTVAAVMTLEQAQRLRELKESTGLRYMMAETSYDRQPCIYARNLYAVEGFGELYYSNSSTTTTGQSLRFA